MKRKAAKTEKGKNTWCYLPVETALCGDMQVCVLCILHSSVNEKNLMLIIFKQTYKPL